MKQKLMLLATSLLLVLTWVSFPVPAVAADPVPIYVDADAGGDNNGTSWTDAYNYLQDALAIAEAGDEIWVAEGTYRPDEGAGQTAGDRGATFQLIDGVAVYGGFAGGETSLGDRDWQINQTIFSGDLAGDDGPDFANNGENSYHVVTGENIGATAILDGCTITAGNADGSYPDSDGGGMYNSNSSPTLANCSFTENWSGSGGGMSNSNSNPALIDCTFSGNDAGWIGGGMYNGESFPELVNCTFSWNSAGSGGGMYNETSSPTLTNCIFSRNTADNDSGGMYNIVSSSPTLTNCILWSNSDSGGSDESAQIHTESGTPVVNNCCLQGWTGALGGTGNIGDDPLFEDPDGLDNIPGTTDDNLRLSAGSPCIDTGTDDGAPTEDIEGNPRPIDGDGDSIATTDMGAYEYAPWIIYVDADAGGANDGTSWTDAYNYLQDALAFAQTGDKIWVAEGTYRPDEGAGQTAGDRQASFQLIDRVAIYGGFAGDEASLSERDWQANQTVLSGDIGITPDDTDNSYHVIIGDSIGVAAILDGFTITAGNADGTVSPAYTGGGMLNINSSNPTLTNCTFNGNQGSGMSNGYLDYYGSSPTLTNCTFSGNQGGGMNNYEGSSPTLTSCTFSNNQGGGMNNDRSSPTLTNCTFIGNESSGMFNGLCSPTLIGCSFSENKGQGMYNAESWPTLTNCIFSGNEGGGMFNGLSSPDLTNCTFSGNEGGGMWNSESSPTLTNCIFWGNSLSGETDESAQIYTSSGTPVINYCCLQGWTGALGGTGNIGDDPLFVDADGPDDIAGTADDNLHLFTGSPCIDAGDNSAVPPGVITDFNGAPRISDGDQDGDAVVDMGAYEGNYVQVTHDLTIEVHGSGSTTPAVGSYTYNEGDVVDITATTDSGWQFVNWTGDVATVADVNADNTTVTINGDYTITANFDEIAEVTYDLTMAVSGNGTTSPAAGPHTYNDGRELNIKATPAAGWQFDSWTGSVADPSSASTTVVMDADKTVTAIFARITHDLTMSAVIGSGSTSPAEGIYTYNEGYVEDIDATPAVGWQFINWTGDVATVADVNAASTTVTMNGDYTITANFSDIPTTTYDLTMAIEGSGSMTPAVGVYTCPEGLVVPITATPAPGWHFDHWTGDVATVADPNTASTTVVMDSDKTITANFAIGTFTLTYTASSGGTLTGQTSQTVDYDGDGTAVQAIASTGYYFVDWSDGSTDNPRTDTNVTSDISVTANFARTTQITYDLTIAVSGNGSTSPSAGPHIYNEGTVVDITATPDSGWQFVNWTGDVADPNAASTTVTMDGNKTVTANFTEIESDILAQQTISPHSPATVSSDDGRIVIQFPASSMAEEAVVTIRKESQDGIPSCPSGFKAGATCFSIEMTADLAPGKTVTIIVKYSDADLEACGEDPDKLTLSRYDEDTEEWIMLPTTVDTGTMTLTASTDQFSTWMIMASEALAGEASNEGGTALWIWLVSIFGGLAVLIAIGGTIVLNKRKSSLWHRLYSRH